MDDTDKKRSKKTTRIPNTHKVKDKKTGGYFNGQELIFLVLVLGQVTFPVNFCFYTPDPAILSLQQQNKRLKRQGVAKKDRPKRPTPKTAYPTKGALTVQMIKDFMVTFPKFKVDAVLAS